MTTHTVPAGTPEAIDMAQAQQQAANLFHEGIFKQAFAERMASRGHRLDDTELDQAISLGFQLEDQAELATKSASSSLLGRALSKAAGENVAATPSGLLLQLELEKLASEAVRLADDPRVYTAAMYLGG